MQMSVGVEYAIHSLFYMSELDEGQLIGIKDLSELHNISVSYLSKIFTKLRKAAIVTSVPGVSGGYKIARPIEEISFWDVVESIEGNSHLFQCAEIRQKNNLFDHEHHQKSIKNPCLIKVIMTDAEDKMRDHLKSVSLKVLRDDVCRDFSQSDKKAMKKWSTSIANKN